MCLLKDLQPHDQFSGRYVVSGYDENSVVFNLIAPPGRLLNTIPKEKEGDWNMTIEEAGEYKLCFRNIKKEDVMISVDVQVHTAEDLKSEAIRHEDLGSLAKLMKKALRSLWNIRTNFKFQEVRYDVHLKNSRTLKSRIKWSGFFKIGVLALVAIGQIYVLTGLLKKREKLHV